MQYSRVHLIGANGVGLSAIGKLLLQKGIRLSGSDLHGGIFFDELKKMGASVHVGHDAALIPENTDLVLYSSAVPENNQELVEARRRRIKTMTYAQILGELSKSYKTIAVAGTHGKSTTTAMLATVMIDAGYDPTVIIGLRVPVWKHANMRIGKSGFLVVEACEYKAHFLELKPDVAVITNIDADHLDYYRDLQHICDTFQKFANQAKAVAVNGDNKESMNLNVKNRIVYYIDDSIKLLIPGRYNLENAAAAQAAALELGIPHKRVRESLENFSGIWRRFEKLGKWRNALVFSDYGHHPTAISQFLKAAKESFINQRLIHIFQPHQHSRTRDLFDEFVDALGEADVTIVPEIYAVAGRMENSDISSENLVETVKKRKPGSDVLFAADLRETRKILENIVRSDDILLFQGAGDIDDLARSLVNGYNKEELRKTYDHIAEDWWKTHSFDDWWVEGTNNFISLLPPKARVLDVGCGGGIKAKYLLSRGLKVIGVDFSKEQIALARRGVPGAEFKILDIYDINRLRGSFDGIFAQASLLHIPRKDIKLVLSKLISKLKRGGLIYVTVKSKDVKGVEEEIKVSDDLGYKYKRFFSYYSKGEMEELFKQAGLRLISSRLLDSGKHDWVQIIGKLDKGC